MDILIKELSKDIILSIADITRLRKYISKKFNNKNSKSNAMILAKTINSIIDKHLEGISETYQPTVKQSLYKNTILGKSSGVSKKNIFDEIVSLDALAEEISTTLHQWVKSNSDIDVSFDEIHEFVEVQKFSEIPTIERTRAEDNDNKQAVALIPELTFEHPLPHIDYEDILNACETVNTTVAAEEETLLSHGQEKEAVIEQNAVQEIPYGYEENIASNYDDPTGIKVICISDEDIALAYEYEDEMDSSWEIDEVQLLDKDTHKDEHELDNDIEDLMFMVNYNAFYTFNKRQSNSSETDDFSDSDDAADQVLAKAISFLQHFIKLIQKYFKILLPHLKILKAESIAYWRFVNPKIKAICMSVYERTDRRLGDVSEHSNRLGRKVLEKSRGYLGTLWGKLRRARDADSDNLKNDMMVILKIDVRSTLETACGHIRKNGSIVLKHFKDSFEYKKVVLISLLLFVTIIYHPIYMNTDDSASKQKTRDIAAEIMDITGRKLDLDLGIDLTNPIEKLDNFTQLLRTIKTEEVGIETNLASDTDYNRKKSSSPKSPTLEQSYPGVPENFLFSPFNEGKLKAFLDGRNSILAQEAYFPVIVETSKEHNLDPRLLFAITGQEQSFVPAKGTNALKIANNPYNVFGSWQKYNTDISDSTEIAIKTVIRMLKDRPDASNPFKWMNRTYAEDPDWWIGMAAIYEMLVEESE